MSQQQNTLAVIFAPLLSTCPKIGQALALAGWCARTAAGDDAECATAGMIVVDGQGRAPCHYDHAIVAAVIKDGQMPCFSVDLIIDPRQDVARIAAQFHQWRIPDTDALVRMEAMFGLDGLLPVVQGLRAELEKAVRGTDSVDAHRIAGLSGILGFAAASAGWQAIDAGGDDRMAALRHSRTALVAINGWMRGHD